MTPLGNMGSNCRQRLSWRHIITMLRLFSSFVTLKAIHTTVMLFLKIYDQLFLQEWCCLPTVTLAQRSVFWNVYQHVVVFVVTLKCYKPDWNLRLCTLHQAVYYCKTVAVIYAFKYWDCQRCKASKSKDCPVKNWALIYMVSPISSDKNFLDGNVS